MKNLLWLWVLALALSACAAPTPSPTPTFTPAPTATPTPVPPTSENWPEAMYALEDESRIGEYTVRMWKDKKQEDFQFARIVTISAPGQETVQIEFFAALGKLTGSDITGEGHPDLIIETYSGGAHCCFSTLVYDLGPMLTKVLQSPESNCGGTFQDLDGDGILEFVTCDDIFAYTYCPYASSPFAPVVLQYQPDAGYVPATPHFADLYAEDIATHRELVETAEDFGEWDETNKCSLLPLVLDYLYSGQPDKAWEALDLYYPFDDRETFQQEIEEMVSQSVLFTVD